MIIYCINLEHRKDRKTHSLKQFNKMDIPYDKVVYLHFTKDKRSGAYGCFDSHMKVWNDFYTNYPNEKYCLVFEDDFVAPPNSKYIIKKATKFLEKNYDDIDILFLHNICTSVDNKANNYQFTNGYGFTNHAMFVSRRYIENIITKYGNLPEPNGRHIDNEITLNQFDKDNVLYSEKLFYTKKECFTQLSEKSENYLNRFDEFIRNHNILTQEKQQKILKNMVTYMKKWKFVDDYQLKKLSYFITNIIT